jgi:hypothetical protein
VAGHACQNLLVQAAALGLGGVPPGAFGSICRTGTRWLEGSLDRDRWASWRSTLPVGEGRQRQLSLCYSRGPVSSSTLRMTEANSAGSSNEGRWPECSKVIISFEGASTMSNHSLARTARPRASWLPITT